MTTASPILSRPLLLRFVSILGSSISFYLPLAVVPMYTISVGAQASAGLATAALLAATVACEMVTPRIVAIAGYRWALAIGLFLLGTPAFALLGKPSVATVVLVSIVRGMGFAITTVAGGALTASLIPDERRGEGIAIVGLVSGVPSMLALPFGVWACGHWGYGAVFAATAIAPLLALPTLPGLPRREAAPGKHHGIIRSLRNGNLVRPAAVFMTSTSAIGVLVTYLPLAITGRQAWVVPVALFIQPTSATAARWLAGRLGDRHGQARLLVPAILMSAAGMSMVALTTSALAVVAGCVLFGCGFGVLQNCTLTLMYSRVPASGYSAVSAIWNAAYDLGMALGAAGAGFAASLLGFGPAFLLAAGVMLPALLLARRNRRTDTVAQPDHSSASELDLSVQPALA